MKKYTLVMEHGKNAFESEMNKLIHEGWVPSGGVSVVIVFEDLGDGKRRMEYVFSQGMIR